MAMQAVLLVNRSPTRRGVARRWQSPPPPRTMGANPGGGKNWVSANVIIFFSPSQNFSGKNRISLGSFIKVLPPSPPEILGWLRHCRLVMPRSIHG